MDQAAPSRRRRVHSGELKAQVQASQLRGVSMAAVAMANGINASLHRRWGHERAQQPAIDAVTASERTVGFVELPMPVPPATPPPSAETIRIEAAAARPSLRRPGRQTLSTRAQP